MDAFARDLEPPMCRAIRKGDIARFIYLMRDPLRAPFNQTDEYLCSGYTYMTCAILHGQEQIVRIMITLPSSELDYNLYRAYLNRAVRDGQPAIFKIIADTGRVDLTERDPKGGNLLHHASNAGCFQTVDYLLNQGVNPDERDNAGRTPLSYAAKDGSEAVTRRLLALGVNPDSKDNEGKTPFYWAIYNSHCAVARILSDTGRVDTSVEDQAKRDGQVRPTSSMSVL